MYKSFLILLIISSFSVSANYALFSEVESGSVKKVFTKKPKNGNYIKIPTGYSASFHKIADEMVDDVTKPVYEAESNVAECDGKDDCAEKLKELDCLTKEHIKNISEQYEKVYCTKILRYNKKATGRKVVMEDDAKKTSYQEQKAAEKMDQAAMQVAAKAIECGKKVISRMLLQNAPKNLKKGQVRTLVKTYKDIKDLLDTGSLESAREDILTVSVDGTIVTEADKAALIKEIDGCKP